ncbi:hypothetical protein HaLaN_30265, partial [Haematococcus lacustris]
MMGKLLVLHATQSKQKVLVKPCCARNQAGQAAQWVSICSAQGGCPKGLACCLELPLHKLLEGIVPFGVLGHCDALHLAVRDELYTCNKGYSVVQARMRWSASALTMPGIRTPVMTFPMRFCTKAKPRQETFACTIPEAMDMLCVRGGSKRCAFPCTRCKVPGQELHNLDSTYEARTEEHQQAVFGRLADASLTANARSQLSQHESTQPVASGLWGWAGLPGGANRAFYPEGMH